MNYERTQLFNILILLNCLPSIIIEQHNCYCVEIRELESTYFKR